MTVNPIPVLSISSLVTHLTEEYAAVWADSSSRAPNLRLKYTTHQQLENEKRLSEIFDELAQAIERRKEHPEIWEDVQENLFTKGIDFLSTAFSIPARDLQRLRQLGLLDAHRAFARQARNFDPNLSPEDIYQAGRNVFTMHFFQVLFGLPVQLTPAIFAYSLLYPYTDNFLDDPAISPREKMEFNQRFYRRLQGFEVQPISFREEQICQLVAMIESQFDRSAYPQVFDSLLAIHSAQTRSLSQQHAQPADSPDVLQISIEKGGTSVLADGFLVAGSLNEDQARFLFGYGAFTQLMDDLEDVVQDLECGSLTLITQCAQRSRLDPVTSQTIHFGAKVFDLMSVFPGEDARILQQILMRTINPLLIASAARTHTLYTPYYLHKLQCGMPFRFAGLEVIQKRMIALNLSPEDWLQLLCENHETIIELNPLTFVLV